MGNIRTEFIDYVIARVLETHYIDSNRDMDAIKKKLKRLYKQGFNADQAYHSVICMEEVNQR